MDTFRTDIENLLLSEMVEEDRIFIMAEDSTIDDIIPVNTIGLFDDTSSTDDDIGDIIHDEYDDLF